MIQQENISGAVAARLRHMIVEGELPPGERINEVRLALRLGVSRTPLREALSGLAAEGALTSAPRLGYFVRPLAFDEFEQVYALRPILDPEALRLAGIPPRERLAHLRDLNHALAETTDVEHVLALDDDFHRALIVGCPNTILLELIDNAILRTRRYEIALMRETHNIARAVDDHARILSALDGGDLDAACAALKHNMQSGAAPIRAWLKARESKGG